MIALHDVSILTPGVFRRAPILLDATETFAMGERIGILAAPGSGKSTLARLLSGIDRPDRGRVEARGRVSWPIGFAGFLHPKLTVEENLGIFAGITGMDLADVVAFCEGFDGIAGLRDAVMQDLTPTQRATLAYACALSVPGPAMWIADETITVGQPDDRERCETILAERLEDGGLIFLSRNPRVLRLHCQRFFVLLNRQLVPCNDLDVAHEALALSVAQQARRH